MPHILRMARIQVKVIALTILGLICQCYHGGPAAATNALEITVANISYQSKWLKHRIASEWNVQHPDVKVTYLPMADYYNQILNIFVTTPFRVDIVRTNAGYMVPWAEAGWIEQIGEAQDLTQILSQIPPSRRLEVSYRGKCYGLPTYTGYMPVFLFNEKYLQKAGFNSPPVTLDDLVNQCLEIKAKEIIQFPLCWHLKGAERRIDWAWYEFTLMKGGKALYSMDWKPTYLNPNSPGYQALAFIIDCLYKYKILDPAALEWDTFRVVDILMKGDCVFAPADPFHLPIIYNPERSTEASEIRMGLMPGSHYTWVKTDQFSITKACKRKGEKYYNGAWKFLKWFCGPDKGSLTYSYASELLSMQSCYNSLNNDPFLRANWSRYADLKALDEQNKYTVSLQQLSPVHKTKFYLPWVHDYLIPNLQAAVSRLKSIDEALLAIHSGFQALAEEYGLPEQ